MKYIRYIIPSALSSVRLFTALAFPFCPEWLWPSLIVIAGLSDVLDGWLARKWQVVSWQGGLVDAISDKCFVLIVLVVCALRGKFSLLWVPLVIARDILVLFITLYLTAFRLWHAFKHMSARISGKMATGGQFVLFLAVIFKPDKTLAALLLASTCSLLAAFDYAWLFNRARKENSPT